MIIGVVEGFFGPAWSEIDRKSYAPFLAQYKADFYIYAPKKDQHLRKKWREPWDDKYISWLKDLRDHFHHHQIKFGIGFSPFGLDANDDEMLEVKFSILNELKIDMLGLFFDDMPSSPDLAQIQLSAVIKIKKLFKGKIIFCPTFYSFDPILEKVFGAKPPQYLETLGEKIPQDISIIWTGPKVISSEISTVHLQETQKLIKRKPFIWENIFANDGPRNFKFLKIKTFTGRDKIENFIEAFGFNLMNQAQLSKIVFLASMYVLKNKMDPDQALVKSLNELCSKEFHLFLQNYKLDFLQKGLDQLLEREKYIHELTLMKDPASQEIIHWLQGHYTVDADCLTD